MQLALAHVSLAAGRSSMDRSAAFVLGSRVVLVAADGAGGTTGGAAAAQAVVDAVTHEIAHGLEPDALPHFLVTLDGRMARDRTIGETTAIVAIVEGRHVRGAIVGDGAACAIDREIHWLTEANRPLLGSGGARPASFAASVSGTLLLATDGLSRYVRNDDLARANEGDVQLAARALTDAARLPTGRLQDDLTLFLLRIDVTSM